MTDETRLNSEYVGTGSRDGLARFATLLRNGTGLALLLGLIAGIAVYMFRGDSPATYTATATLLLTSPQQGLDGLGIVTPAPVDASAYRTLILDGPLLERALVARGETATVANIDALRRNLRVSIDSQQVSSVIRIELTDLLPVRAADIANALASYTINWDRERGRQGLNSGITSLERSVQQLQNQLAAQQEAEADTTVTAALLAAQQTELEAARTRLDSIVVAPLIDVLSFAEPATEADDRHQLLYALAAFAATAVAVYAIVFIRMLLNYRLRSPGEAASVTGLPVYSVFPGAGYRNDETARRDAADLLRASLLDTEDLRDVDSLVFLVTTAETKNSTYPVSAALAESFSRAGFSTLLVDANLRKPSLGKAFGLREGDFASLEQYMVRPDQKLDFIDVHLDGTRKFSFLPSFRAENTATDSLRAALPGLVSRWRRRFNVIVLETAAVLPYPDTLEIAGTADRALLVAGVGRSDPDSLQTAADALRKFRANKPGLVLVDVPRRGWRFGNPPLLSRRYSIAKPRSAKRRKR